MLWRKCSTLIIESWSIQYSVSIFCISGNHLRTWCLFFTHSLALFSALMVNLLAIFILCFFAGARLRKRLSAPAKTLPTNLDHRRKFILRGGNRSSEVVLYWLYRLVTALPRVVKSFALTGSVLRTSGSSDRNIIS